MLTGLIADDVAFAWSGEVTHGGLYTQAFETEDAQLLGHYTETAGPYAKDRAALASHVHGEGRTLLCGTHPGYCAYNAGGSPFFAQVAAWADLTPRYALPAPCFARLCEGSEGRFLWLINPSREVIHVELSLEGSGEAVRGDVKLGGGVLQATLHGRDAAIVRLTS